jgi:hypothetical protein
VKLSDLRPAPGSHKLERRVGRGHGSGRGKTAGRGTKDRKLVQVVTSIAHLTVVRRAFLSAYHLYVDLVIAIRLSARNILLLISLILGRLTPVLK